MRSTAIPSASPPSIFAISSSFHRPSTRSIWCDRAWSSPPRGLAHRPILPHIRRRLGSGSAESGHLDDHQVHQPWKIGRQDAARAARSSFMRQAHPPFRAGPNQQTCDWTAPNVVGFDPFIQLGDLVERRWLAATNAARRAA